MDNINLTEEEKIDFLTKLKVNNITKTLNNFKNFFKIYNIFFTPIAIFGCLLSCIFTPGALFLLPFFLVSKIIVDIIICAPVYFDSKRDVEGILKSVSKGKINYKQYRYLVKSGILNDWENLYKEEINRKTLETKGIEVEEYLVAYSDQQSKCSSHNNTISAIDEKISIGEDVSEK